mgnify:CR=1 FL=1
MEKNYEDDNFVSYSYTDKLGKFIAPIQIKNELERALGKKVDLVTLIRKVISPSDWRCILVMVAAFSIFLIIGWLAFFNTSF